jgi:hypothetical protein
LGKSEHSKIGNIDAAHLFNHQTIKFATFAPLWISSSTNSGDREADREREDITDLLC